MITVEFSHKDRMASLHVKGHAGAAEVGKDLVCASASILAYTLGQSVEFLHREGKVNKPKLSLKEGDATIRCRAKDDIAFAELSNVYWVIENGYLLLAKNFPEYVEIVNK